MSLRWAHSHFVGFVMPRSYEYSDTKEDNPLSEKTVDGFNWTASSEFGTNHLCEQRRFRRACASAQSRQNLRCSLIQAVSPEEPSDKKKKKQQIPGPSELLGMRS